MDAADLISRISIALFLTNLEIPIVTTSVVAITDDIGGFDKASWLISSYLLGYVGTYPSISSEHRLTHPRRCGDICKIERCFRSQASSCYSNYHIHYRFGNMWSGADHSPAVGFTTFFCVTTKYS